MTVTAVRPPARFGLLKINRNKVTYFKEKPQSSEGWINGGFFVMELDFLKFISGKGSILEKLPLENAQKRGQLCAFKHYGFWKCMDTKRDKDVLETFYKKKFNLNKENLIIIGGTGFIGFNLIKKFIKKRKFNIISLSSSKPSKLRKLKGVRYLICDILKKKKT